MWDTSITKKYNIEGENLEDGPPTFTVWETQYCENGHITVNHL